MTLYSCMETNPKDGESLELVFWDLSNDNEKHLHDNYEKLSYHCKLRIITEEE